MLLKTSVALQCSTESWPWVTIHFRRRTSTAQWFHVFIWQPRLYIMVVVDNLLEELSPRRCFLSSHGLRGGNVLHPRTTKRPAFSSTLSQNQRHRATCFSMSAWVILCLICILQGYNYKSLTNILLMNQRLMPRSWLRRGRDFLVLPLMQCLMASIFCRSSRISVSFVFGIKIQDCPMFPKFLGPPMN